MTRALAAILLVTASPGAGAADGLPDVTAILLQLLLVLAVIAVCAWFARRVPQLRRGTAALNVKETLALGARERLVIVEFDRRELLLGINGQGITLLCERQIDAHNDAADAETPAEDREADAFLKLLGQVR